MRIVIEIDEATHVDASGVETSGEIYGSIRTELDCYASNRERGNAAITAAVDALKASAKGTNE